MGVVNDFRAAWLSTRVLVINRGLTIDLDEVPVGGLASAVLPVMVPVCIVTAWNPGGEDLPLQSNKAANLRLQADLDAIGLRWIPADGVHANRSRSEPGFAVGGLSEREARDLGRGWGQLAVFYVAEQDVVVLGCDDELSVRAPTREAGSPIGRPGSIDVAESIHRCLAQMTEC